MTEVRKLTRGGWELCYGFVFAYDAFYFYCSIELYTLLYEYCM